MDLCPGVDLEIIVHPIVKVLIVAYPQGEDNRTMGKSRSAHALYQRKRQDVNSSLRDFHGSFISYVEVGGLIVTVRTAFSYVRRPPPAA